MFAVNEVFVFVERDVALTDACLQTKVWRDAPARSLARPPGTRRSTGDEWSGNGIFHPFTHTTQQGTHVMHHAVISDSEVEVITLGGAPPPPRRPPLSLRGSRVSHRSGRWRQLILSP